LLNLFSLFTTNAMILVALEIKKKTLKTAF